MKGEQMFLNAEQYMQGTPAIKNPKAPQVFMNQNSFESTYNSQMQWKATLPAIQRHSRAETTTE